MTLEFIANSFLLTGSIIILFCAIAFLRAKNILESVHYVICSNIYGLTILLIGIMLRYFEIENILKITILLVLNFIVSVLLQQLFNFAIKGEVLKKIKICKTDF